MLDEKLLYRMLETMILIRQFDEKVGELFGAGRLPGFVHLYVGEEAVATGVCCALRPDDYITSTHRGHGHCLAKGGDANRMMAELMGKRDGYCKGKGGSMHIANIELGILGANGVVAAGIPIATGAALSAAYRKSGQVAVSFFGDGATNQSGFHEGINLGSILRLPVIYVCENNLFAITTPTSYHQRVTDVAERATSYGIPGVVVDGTDVVAVYEVTAEAVDRARKGEGPTFIECKTYRYYGHFQGDPQLYRTKEEVDEWRARDPILRLKKQMISRNLLTEKQYGEVEQWAADRIARAVEFAEQSPLPDPTDTLQDVFDPTTA